MSVTWVDQIGAVFRAHGAVNPNVATTEDLWRFEQKFSVSIPPDWRRYFSELNGTTDGFMGCGVADIGFSHLSQVIRLVEWDSQVDLSWLPHPACWFVFADFAINCLTWAVCWAEECHAPNPVLVDNGNGLIEVFADIETFVAGVERSDIGWLIAPERHGESAG